MALLERHSKKINNRSKVLYILFFALMLLIIPIVSAQYTTDSTGATFGTSAGNTNKAGMEFISRVANLVIHNITKDSLDTSTTCYLYANDSGTLLASASFVGNNCRIDYSTNAVANTSFIAVIDSNGSARDLRRQDGTTSQVNGTNIDYRRSYFNFNSNSSEQTSIYAISSITTRTSVPNVTVAFINPSDNIRTTNTTLIFNASLTPSSMNLSNATFFIYYSNGSIANRTVNTVQGTTINYSFINYTLSTGNFTWNVLGCAKNTTTHTCNYAGNNRTFTSGITENSITYNSSVREGSLETFVLNITYNNNSYTSISAILNYNGSSFTTTKVGSGDTVLFTRSLNVPLVSGTTNIAFNWTIQLTGTTSTVLNSTTNTQTITNLNIDNCGSFGILLLNYTLRDEETREFINATFYNSTAEVDVVIRPIGSPTLSVINKSFNYSLTNNPKVCLETDLGNSSYELYVTTRYGGDLYASEFHYIQNSTLSNSSLPQRIDLHDLKLTDTTEFLITFKDEFFSPVENALIDIQRKYVGNGTFRSVEISKSDSNGQAIAHLDRDNVLYSIIVTKDREILAVFDNIAVVCQDLVIGRCEINLNQLSTITSVDDFEDFGNLSYSFSFDKSMRRISLIFTTTDGSSKTVTLNSTKFDRFGNNTICFQSATTNSGTLVCDIPSSYGNVSVISYLYVGNKLITQRIFQLSADAVGQIGRSEAGIYTIFLVLTLAFMFMSSLFGVMIGVVIGVIASSIMLFIEGGSIFATGSYITLLIITALIIIIKISRRER